MRRHALRTIFFSLLASMVAVAVPTGAEAQKLKITSVMAGDGFQYIIQHIATRGGFFEQEGLDVETVDAGSGPRQVAALMGGSSAFSGFGLVQAIRANAEGAQLVAISSLINIFDQKIVLSNAAIKKSGITLDMSIDEKVKRMRGMRFAITSPGSTTDLIVRSLLQYRNMDPDEALKILPMGGGTNMLAAMEKDATDAFIWAAPQSHMAVTRGIGQIVINPLTETIPEFDGVYYMGMVTSRDTLAKKPEMIRAAVRALARAMKFTQEKPDEARKLVRQHFPDAEEDVFNAAWADYRRALPVTPVIGREQFEKTQKWLNAVAKTSFNVPYESVVNDAVARQAEAEILKK